MSTKLKHMETRYNDICDAINKFNMDNGNNGNNLSFNQSEYL